MEDLTPVVEDPVSSLLEILTGEEASAQLLDGSSSDIADTLRRPQRTPAL